VCAAVTHSAKPVDGDTGIVQGIELAPHTVLICAQRSVQAPPLGWNHPCCIRLFCKVEALQLESRGSPARTHRLDRLVCMLPLPLRRSPPLHRCRVRLHMFNDKDVNDICTLGCYGSNKLLTARAAGHIVLEHFTSTMFRALRQHHAVRHGSRQLSPVHPGCHTRQVARLAALHAPLAHQLCKGCMQLLAVCCSIHPQLGCRSARCLRRPADAHVVGTVMHFKASVSLSWSSHREAA
jgi:hypothetical protein